MFGRVVATSSETPSAWPSVEVSRACLSLPWKPFPFPQEHAVAAGPEGSGVRALSLGEDEGGKLLPGLVMESS